MNALEQAIDKFYDAFSDIPAPSTIEGCPCCISADEIDKLLQTPLRELRQEDLSSYASSAFLTVGSVSDYLYFLPRILELSIYFDWWPDIEVTGRAIRETNVMTWQAMRLESLTRLLLSTVTNILERSEYWRLDDWLCAIGRMGVEIQPFLEQIESSRKAVLELWKSNAGHLHENKLGNAFWDLPNKAHDDIVNWLKSDRNKELYAEEYGYKI